MLLSAAQRLRVYGSAERVAEVNAYIADLVAEAPPLTASQRARLRVLIRPAVASGPAVSPPLKHAA